MLFVAVEVGGVAAVLAALPPEDPTCPTEEEIKKASQRTKEKYLAVALLTAADRSRFGKLVKDLENDFTKGQNIYPTSVTAAYNLLMNYKCHQKTGVQVAGDGDRLSFANVGGTGKKEKDMFKIICFKCGEAGHYASQCPSKDKGRTKTGGEGTQTQEGDGSGDMNLVVGDKQDTYGNVEEFSFHQSH